MRNLFVLILISLFTFCKGSTNSEEDKNSILTNLGIMSQRSNRLTISGTAVKGIVKNAIVTVSSLNKDGSCSASSILATETTDELGNYSLVYNKTGSVVCLTVATNPNGKTSLFDEKANSDVSVPTTSTFKLVTILPESKIINNNRKNAMVSPFSKLLAKRLQYLIKQAGEGANVSALHKKASKEIVVRFGLQSGLSASSGKANPSPRASTTSINEINYPELDDILLELDNPSSPLTAKFISILVGFSHLANKYKKGATISIDDIDAMIEAFAVDFEDGIFDGRGIDGNPIIVGVFPNQIIFSNNTLTTILLPGITSYFADGGKLTIGRPISNTLPATSTITSAQIASQIEFVDTTPIISSAEPTSTPIPTPTVPTPVTVTTPTSAAPSAMSYSGSPFNLTTNLAMNPILPTVTGTIISCAVTPVLPAGLVFNITTCQIAGTPTLAQGATSYTITASNSFGSTTATISIAVTNSAILTGATPSSYSTRYGDFELNGNFYYKILNGTEYLVKVNAAGQYDSGFGTAGKLSIPINGTNFLACGGKVFGLSVTGGNYRIHKFNDAGAGSIATAVDSIGVTTGNGLNQMYCIDGIIYLAVIDNGAPATGTGLMKFDTSSETFTVQFINYTNQQISAVFKDSASQLWIQKSSAPQFSKINASLGLVAGGEKTASLIGSLYYISTTDLCFVSRANASDVSAIFIGTVDDFLVDITDGTLNGASVKNLAIHQAGKNKNSSGIVAARGGNKIFIMDYYLNVTPYEFATSLFDWTTATIAPQFNAGSIQTLTYTPYDNFNGRNNAHLTFAQGYFYFVYQKVGGAIIVDKFLP
ncbi:MAG: putative Ig domain-containing protein [Leptospiraceae bacterium]|nr:putative Ig domain-containing protein [Leptospiraceae bacterium]MBP9165042.1 putative Ig domain-containing protein [Leptospiraceae bacterium]